MKPIHLWRFGKLSGAESVVGSCTIGYYTELQAYRWISFRCANTERPYWLIGALGAE